MSNLSRREFIQISAASLMLRGAESEGNTAPWAKVTESPTQLRVECSKYTWEWSKESDLFRLLDSAKRVMCTGPLQPVVLVQTAAGRELFRGTLSTAKTRFLGANHFTVTYEAVERRGSLSLELKFDEAWLWLGPVVYESSAAENVVALHYFAAGTGNGVRPSLRSNFLILPGVSASSGISPIIPAEAGMHATSWLGHGGPPKEGLRQQWGLPVHYFCGLHRNCDTRQKGAMKEQLSDAFCCGLAEFPSGDVYLQTESGQHSLIVNYRGDLWGEPSGPGRLTLGAKLCCAVGPNYWQAIRQYYAALVSAEVIAVKTNTAHKNAIALSPEFNTYGMQVAMHKAWKLFDETTLSTIYDGLEASSMNPKMFVIDADWEEKYGDLHHSVERFPHFEETLARIRSGGYHVGLWSAFMRCEDPTALGLTTQHMLHLPGGNPYVAKDDLKPYYILDCTQDEVQQVLRHSVKRFLRRYRPDLVKFDFGYELPPLETAAPKDMRWAGERFLQKAVEVVVKAMREENPDLVVLYYSLSPLLIDYFDLHSPDDLVACAGDYDLEANRRFFFSSLLGEIGMPTCGSGGYDWRTMPSIWFDSIVAGTLGCLNSFAGDEEDSFPTSAIIAKFNGLSQLVRPANVFTIEPIDVDYFGPARGARISSWARLENGEPVLVALRKHSQGGGENKCDFRGTVRTTASVVVASKSSEGIARAPKLGIVPYGEGELVIGRADTRLVHVTVSEHYFGGKCKRKKLPIQGGSIRLQLSERGAEGALIEWIELEIHSG